MEKTDKELELELAKAINEFEDVNEMAVCPITKIGGDTTTYNKCRRIKLRCSIQSGGTHELTLEQFIANFKTLVTSCDVTIDGGESENTKKNLDDAKSLYSSIEELFPKEIAINKKEEVEQILNRDVTDLIIAHYTDISDPISLQQLAGVVSMVSHAFASDFKIAAENAAYKDIKQMVRKQLYIVAMMICIPNVSRGAFYQLKVQMAAQPEDYSLELFIEPGVSHCALMFMDRDTTIFEKLFNDKSLSGLSCNWQETIEMKKQYIQKLYKVLMWRHTGKVSSKIVIRKYNGRLNNVVTTYYSAFHIQANQVVPAESMTNDNLQDLSEQEEITRFYTENYRNSDNILDHQMMLLALDYKRDINNKQNSEKLDKITDTYRGKLDKYLVNKPEHKHMRLDNDIIWSRIATFAAQKRGSDTHG